MASTDLADVVSRSTGIPIAQLTEAERDRLLRLEEELHGRVVAGRRRPARSPGDGELDATVADREPAATGPPPHPTGQPRGHGRCTRPIRFPRRPGPGDLP